MLERAVELGVEQIALVDYMSVSAMPIFSERAAKLGITPIVGCTLQIVDDPTAKLKDKDNNAYRLKVYVKDDSGLRSLFRVLSKSLTADHYYYHARLGLEDVLSMEGVVVTSGDIHSLWHHPKASEIHARLQHHFGLDYYVELTAIDTPLFDRINKLAVDCSFASATPVSQRIITRPALYLTDDDADSTDVLRAITSNTSVYSRWLSRPWARDLSLLAPVAAATHFARTGKRAGIDALVATKNIVPMMDKCQYRFTKLKPCLPKMAEDEFAALMSAVKVGWNERFLRSVWGHKPSDADLASIYRDRLRFELGVLGKMGFSGYFLLVQDIVRWSKANGIMVGPGRGSVGGSLVAYLMGITDIDPIRFDLLFERFINPDRLDLPDADLDFESGKRHKVVEYITQKWGSENVAGIVNFSTLGAASALRDTARLHGLSPLDYACSKQMEKEHGVSLGLEESALRVPDIEKFQSNHPIIWNHALRLEGANRSLSQHAAGVVVAGEPINSRAVVSTRGGPEDLGVIQWDKSQVENFGLIKIDVLGLNTLDLINIALGYIKERHHKAIDILSLPLDDDLVLKAFGRGDTTGVFQFSGGGMKSLLKEMAIGGQLTFDDLCAATALFRPGPLDAGLCDRYVAVKKGIASPYYEHPILEDCLGDTFGVIVYQEQVMRVARELAGFTPGESDLMRKAIGKKSMELMETMSEQFVVGAEAGYAKVDMDDGRVLRIHRKRKLKCADGKLRTIDEALTDDADIVELL